MLIPSRIRNAISDTSKGGPSLYEWAERIEKLSPELAAIAERVLAWQGQLEGNQTLTVPGYQRMLVFGWCYGRVEYAYLS